MPLFRHRHDQPTDDDHREAEPEAEVVHPFVIPDQPEGPYREVGRQ